MSRIEVTTLDDPHLAVYRNLPNSRVAGQSGRFIVEGAILVQRLIESPLAIDSILVARRHEANVAPYAPEESDLIVVPDDMLDQIVGFKFHRGVIACGHRPEPVALQDVASTDESASPLVVCPEILDQENLGSIIRVCAGFGAAGLLLGPSSADPFSRRAVRVSMGTVFKLPVVQSDDLLSDLQWLQSTAGYQLIATVTDEDAIPLHRAGRPQKLALLLGSEGPGLSQELIDQCDQSVTIPMHHNTDSLNVAVAAGVILYHFTRPS
ncbi:MAG: RNA methyltransferase [Planctomycetes bacterium]|nr:RNA methyltransferase [Planctomycetota bacterium]